MASTFRQLRGPFAPVRPVPAQFASGLLAVVLILASCGPGEPPLEVGVRDSLGIRIVQLGPLNTPPTDIRLAPGPVYQVGWLPGEPVFEHVVAGALLPDGRAAIGDQWSRTITVLSPSGEVERVLGGRGSGPGEIQTIIQMARLGEDTLVVQDNRNARFTLFHADSLLRSVPLSGPAQIAGVDRQFLIRRTATHNSDFPEAWLRGVVTRLDLASGRVDTVRSFDWVQNRRGRPRFPPGGEVGVTRGAILLGRSDRAQVEWVTTDGRLAQILSWEADRPRLSEEDWAVYEDYFMTEPVFTVSTEDRRELFAQMRPPIGRPLPHFGRLLGDDRGNAWVADYSVNWRTSARFEVFTADGDWLGSVSLPPRFQVLDIAESRVLGVQFNDLGVAAAVVYRIEW